MVQERLSNEHVTRKPGHLYYIGKDGLVHETPIRGKPGTKGTVTKIPVNKEKGYLYFLDKEGYPARAKMGRGKK